MCENKLKCIGEKTSYDWNIRKLIFHTYLSYILLTVFIRKTNDNTLS